MESNKIPETIATVSLPISEEAPPTPNALTGAFKAIDFAKISFTCTKCAKTAERTIPTDIVSYITCSSCKKTHTADPTYKTEKKPD